MSQTGPREIGANLAFGVNLALFILQCTSIVPPAMFQLIIFVSHL